MKMIRSTKTVIFTSYTCFQPMEKKQISNKYRKFLRS